jgi:hypothetical protein
MFCFLAYDRKGHFDSPVWRRYAVLFNGDMRLGRNYASFMIYVNYT